MTKTLPKVNSICDAIVIAGPTASGKTKLAFQLALAHNGEILSADSRQVYQGMDIVTGKDMGANKFVVASEIQNNSPLLHDLKFGYYLIDGIKVWGLDFVRPDCDFSISHFYFAAQLILENIRSRGKLPIIVGGTGLYLKTLLDPPQTLAVPQDEKLREELNLLNASQLQLRLQEVDLPRYQQMNQSDQSNPRRLVRAIEVSLFTGGNSPQVIQPLVKNPKVVFLHTDKESLESNIRNRVEDRLENEAIVETQNLLDEGFSPQLPSMSALGYQEIIDYLAGKYELHTLIDLWVLHETQYAKRQMVWFKKYLDEATRK